MANKNLGFALCILSTIYTGCGDDVRNTDAGPQATDASSPSDAGPLPAEDAGPPATDAGSEAALVVRRQGARVFGPVLAVSRQARNLYLGTVSIFDPVDPEGELRGGLVRLGLDDGAVEVHSDDLPSTAGPFGGFGPISTGGVVEDGQRLLAVGHSGLVVREAGAFRLVSLPVDGEDASPTHLVLDRPSTGAAARLWVASSRGLLLLDADTLTLTRRFGRAELGAEDMGALALDPATRALYTVGYDDSGVSHLNRIELGALEEIRALDVDAARVQGRIRELAWSTRLDAVVFTVAAFNADAGGVYAWDGASTREIATEGQLAEAARGERVAFGASALALDDETGVLVVGGVIQPTGPVGILVGGGLAWIDLARLNEGLFITGMSVGTSDIPGDYVAALAYDPITRRTFASLRQPCNEIRLGNVGLVTVVFEDGKPRFEASILSGVRDLTRLDGELVVGMRDDTNGALCDAVNVRRMVAEVNSAGTGLALDMRSTGGDGEFTYWRTTRLGPVQVDFSDSDHRLVAAPREDLYIGGANGRTYNPALTFNVSLDVRAVSWLGASSFAIGGGTSHSLNDPDTLANVGPHGAAIAQLGEGGRILSYTQYVRAVRDPSPNVVAGLPSNEVWDLVPGRDGSVYVVCGIERVRRGPYDRMESDPYRVNSREFRGGIAQIGSDGSVSILAGSADVPDPRAAVLDDDGNLLVLDARQGLLSVAPDGTVTTRELPDSPPTGSIPTSLYVHADTLVATYSTGAVVQIGDLHGFIDEVGWAWRAIESDDGVLAIGTDEGLVEVWRPETPAPAHAARLAGELPPFATLRSEEPPPPDTDGGVCSPEHTPCRASEECCAGLTCAGSGFVLECIAR